MVLAIPQQADGAAAQVAAPWHPPIFGVILGVTFQDHVFAMRVPMDCVVTHLCIPESRIIVWHHATGEVQAGVTGPQIVTF